ncbi:MAG TPA: FkbM family methyltransferase [Thermoanaerobaculia bacterium]
MSAPSILYPTELSFLNAGSQQSIVELLATRDRAFYRRVVVCPPGAEYVAALERLGVTVHVAGTHAHQWRFSPKQPLGTLADLLAATRAVDTLVERENVRLIHANSLVAGIAAAVAKRRHPSLRLVLHERGLIYRAHTRFLFRRVARQVDRFVATTATGRRQLVAWGAPAEKIAVIPNGTRFVAPPRNVGQASACPGQAEACPTFVIGLVANFVRVKRHELFLDVLARLGDHVRGVIVGGVMPILDGAPYEREIRARAAVLGLGERVRFLGPRDDVAEQMAAMDVLLCTSSHESFGRVLVEAMAVGTPVVATPVGGIPDVIDDGRTGLLAHDADGLAAAVRRILDDPALAARLASAAQEEVRQRFDAAAVTRSIEDVYRELLGGAPASSPAAVPASRAATPGRRDAARAAGGTPALREPRRDAAFMLRPAVAFMLRRVLRGPLRGPAERVAIALGHRFPHRLPGRGLIAEELMRMHAGRPVEARLFDGARLLVPATREAFFPFVTGRCFAEDEGLTRLLLRSLGDDDVFFDVGANVGYYSILAAGRGARVHAFDAQEALVGLLRRSVERNGYGERVTVNHAAVCERHGGEVELFLPAERETLLGVASLQRHEWLRGGTRVRVPALALDGYARERGLTRLDVVKIDVEGAEEGVVRGMSGLLERSCPRLIVAEVWPEALRFDSIEAGRAMRAEGGARFEAVARLLRGFGYEAHAIGGDGTLGERFTTVTLQGLRAAANVAFARDPIIRGA